MEMSELLHQAAQQGDAKAALAILQNVHGWVAKQAISVDVNQQISITAALQEAQRRVLDVVEVIGEDTSVDRLVSSDHLARQPAV
jgi:DNA-binding transcriptional MocR family regulator